MLLIDGVKYEARMPSDEEELENMVVEHHKEIFGPECLYFDVKHKLKAKSVAAIPDALAITFNPDRWWIIETELSTHPIYEHIQNQVGKFIAALPRPNTRQEVISVLWQEINANELVKFNLQRTRGGELFKWLSDLINQQPQLAIIIDKRASELDDAIAALNIQPTVIEFATYVREGVGLSVHAHLFEPLYRVPAEMVPTTKQRGEIITIRKVKGRVTVKNLIDANILKVGQVIYRSYKGQRFEGKVLNDGRIELAHTGEKFDSLSSAAEPVAGSVDGWTWWRTTRANGEECLLDELRNEYKSNPSP